MNEMVFSENYLVPLHHLSADVFNEYNNSYCELAPFVLCCYFLLFIWSIYSFVKMHCWNFECFLFSIRFLKITPNDNSERSYTRSTHQLTLPSSVTAISNGTTYIIINNHKNIALTHYNTVRMLKYKFDAFI